MGYFFVCGYLKEELRVETTQTFGGFILDTNVFNHVIEEKIPVDLLPTKFSIFATHVQEDELNGWVPSDEAQELKKRLVLRLFQKVVDHKIPTRTTICGVSRLGESLLGAGELQQKILDYLMLKKPKELSANQNDALIGEVAITNRLELITNDKALKAIVTHLGGRVVDLRANWNNAMSKNK